MIFNLFQRFNIKIGDESYVFDRRRLMFTEVAEIEKVSGLSYMEWERELGRYSAAALGPLVHILRKRADKPSDYKTMQFNMADLDCVPLREDDTEYTAAEIAEDIRRRIDDAQAGPDPTPSAAVPAAEAASPATTSITSPSSPHGSESARGSSTSSHGRTSSGARRGLTRS